MKKFGSAKWSGSLKDGKGHVSTESGAIKDIPYGFNTRFEDTPGSNPEELIGAAHAACFSMALSGRLGADGLTPDEIVTKAEITLEKRDGGFAVTRSHLTVSAKIPGASDAQFQEAAKKAKETCPISQLLNADISMDATLT